MYQQNSPPGKMTDYKSNSKRVLEVSFICSLIFLSTLFYSSKKFDHTAKIFVPKPITIIMENIPITKPPTKINRPELPKMPVAAEDDEFCKDVPMMDYNDIDIESLIASSGPPVDDEEGGIPFYAVSEKPILINRIEPIYPELARKAGIEGNVVTKVLIGKTGDIESAEIFKSVPMLDKSALQAVKQFKFEPGKQRDKFVKVWMYIPFTFKLR